MFDQITNQLAGEGSACSPASPPDLKSEELLETIIARLEQDVPQRTYLEDKWLAQTLGVELKTLMNRRSGKPDRYPQPLHLAGGQGGFHVRRELIAWLAGEELQAKTRRVHKCR